MVSVISVGLVSISISVGNRVSIIIMVIFIESLLIFFFNVLWCCLCSWMLNWCSGFCIVLLCVCICRISCIRLVRLLLV